MKKIVLTIVLSLIGGAAFAEELPNSSAFSDGKNVYVTILEDCNVHLVELVPNSLCQDDRRTRNLASVCNATLAISKTRKLCPQEQPLEPVVHTFSLKESNVAREARTLYLDVQGDVLEVKLKN